MGQPLVRSANSPGALTRLTASFSKRGRELIERIVPLSVIGRKGARAEGPADALFSLATALLSGRKSRMVALRAREMGIVHVMQGIENKLEAYRSLLRKQRLAEEETSFMGDDLPDLPVLRRCGLAFSVPGAPDIVRSHVHYVTRAGGGHGAAREVCEFLMQARGTFEQQMKAYLA